MLSDREKRLAGSRILVIEDEYFLADDLQAQLRAEGAEVIGPFGDLDEARRAANRETLDVAVMDILLRGETTYAIADQLTLEKIPFLFATGYSAEVMPRRFQNVACLEKPYELSEIVDYLVRLRRSVSCVA